MVEAEIVEKHGFRVVGLEAPFRHALSREANNLEVIGGLWERFLEVERDVTGRVGEASYGVISARAESERSHPDELLYLAGFAVGEGAPLPAGMAARTVPAGTYAVFEHRGPIREIRETVAAIYREWLPSSGYRHGEGPDVELYDGRFCPEGEESVMEYWVGVV